MNSYYAIRLIVRYDSKLYMIPIGNVDLDTETKTVSLKKLSNQKQKDGVVIDFDHIKSKQRYTLTIKGATQGFGTYVWIGSVSFKGYADGLGAVSMGNGDADGGGLGSVSFKGGDADGAKERMFYLKPLEFDNNGFYRLSFKTKRLRGDERLRLIVYFRSKKGDRFILDSVSVSEDGGRDNREDILVIGDFRRMKESVSLNRYLFWHELSKTRPNVYLFGTDHDDWQEGISIFTIVEKLGIQPKKIYHHFYGDKLLATLLGRYPCRKSLILEDMHKTDTIAKAIVEGDFKRVLYNCDCPELDLIKRVCSESYGKRNIDYEHFPHLINTDIFKNYGLDKCWDIIIYGSTNREYYPFRHRLRNLLERGDHGLRVKSIPFTGYIGENNIRRMPRGKDLSMLINRSWIGISTRSKVDYFVKKYVEIPASYAMVAGDIPSRNSDVLKGMIRLDPSMSDEEIVSRLKSALSDKKALMRSIGELHRRVLKEFALFERLKYFS